MFANHDVRFDEIDPDYAGLSAAERKEKLTREIGTMMEMDVQFETPAQLLALLDEGIAIVARRTANPSPMDMVLGDTFTVVFAQYRAALVKQVPELADRAPSRSLN
ncbi:hypothetical protein ACFDR9_000554 [Janthinobacterium sp. CG_23.3]|uniref:hypothetical protein n=1 Tax=Janthinobacterium sp. CG_23.3 TaxID=3349634 RepID=UPI0038D4FAB7